MGGTAVKLGAFALIAAFAIFSFGLKTELRKNASPLEDLKIGQPAPDFALTDTSGHQIDLHDTAKQNKLVLINFWATWCGPCRLEMPQFERVYNEKKDEGFIILALSDEAPEKLEAYLKKKPLSFPVLLDRGGKVAEKYGIRAFPTSIIVDRDGKILKVNEGIEPHLEFHVEMWLKEQSEKQNAAKK